MKWSNVPMATAADVASGFGFPLEYQGVSGEEYPFFKVGDMNLPGNEKCMAVTVNTISGQTLKKLKARAFPAGTVIFPKIGAAIATNKKRMLVQPSVVDNNVMGLLPKPHTNPWYLFYWMLQFDLRSVSNIGPVPSMRKTEVEQILIPSPLPSEQRRIVEILDQADALRRQRSEADAKAARLLPSLFFSMFGDPATNSLGWRKDSLGSVILEAQYGTSARAEANGDGIAVIRMNNIDITGRLDLADLKYSNLSDAERKRYSLKQGDLLFNRTNSKELVGKTGLWKGDFPAVAASYLIRVRVDLEQVLPSFIWAYMNSRFIKQLLFDKCRRAIGMANINAKELRALPLIVPPLELQEDFARRAEALAGIETHRMSSRRSIENLFANMLHRAFLGDLTAEWREAHMEELLKEMGDQAAALGL